MKYSLVQALNINSNDQKSNFKEKLSRKTLEYEVCCIGTLKVTDRKAREGRNPQTGEKIKIAARKAIAFSASSALKESVNS